MSFKCRRCFRQLLESLVRDEQWPTIHYARRMVWFDASFFMLCNIPFYHFMPHSKWSSVWKRYYSWAFLIYLTSSVWTLYSFSCCFSQRSLRWTGDGLQYIEPQAERVRHFDSYIDLGFAISSVKPKGLWVGLAIWGLFLSLTNTYTHRHTHIYILLQLPSTWPALLLSSQSLVTSLLWHHCLHWKKG